MRRIRAISKVVNKSGAQTAKVTIVKNGIEFSFKTATDTLKRSKTTYSRWDITAAERIEEKVYTKPNRVSLYKPKV